MEGHELNARSLERELTWLNQVIRARFDIYFQRDKNHAGVGTIKPPDLSNDPSVFAATIKNLRLSTEERLIVILALAPHVKPHLLDVFFTKNSDYDRGFS